MMYVRGGSRGAFVVDRTMLWIISGGAFYRVVSGVHHVLLLLSSIEKIPNLNNV